MEDKSEIWFWNKSANEIDLDFKEENKLDKKDWKKKQSSMQQDISHKVFKVEIKWNKKKE